MKISVPIHKGRDIPVGTLRAIVRQLGISVEEWSKL
ncbi:MAG: type II toxin-antitoxin system HicA family toxin [Dehalococcoidia bacterium]